ncbi:MAG: 5'/3'-nucleotidase SurE [Methanomicrobium sp.]|nr:5'/3'-nucleotidase SurE [Methanomicrobium sp.]
MRPRILLTNDDGVTSEGIWAAYSALSEFADVTVVAPSTQQSAVGRSTSVFEPLRVSKVKIKGHDAYSVSGKPTDCVIIGLFALDLKPDLVVSGVNIGENLSYESVMTSGTVGAAMEAANQGVHAIAFSQQVDDQSEKFDDPRQSRVNFEGAGKVIAHICGAVFEKGFPAGCHVLNVNIPIEITGGYEVTHLGEKLFVTGVEKRLDPRGRPYYWINGPLIDEAPKGTDTYALYHGNISVTPLTLDTTAYKSLDGVKELIK